MGVFDPAATVIASAARTTSGQSAAQQAGNARSLSVGVNASAVSGTTPTLDVRVEWSHDGTIWFAGDPADSISQMTAVGGKVKTFTVKAPAYRIAYTIGGTTPSFTFSASTYLS